MPKKSSVKVTKSKAAKRTSPRKARSKSPRKSPKNKTAAKPPKAIPVPAKSALLAVIPKVSRAQFTAGGQAILLSRFAKKTIALWNIASASETPPLKALPNFTAAALSPDNRFIALGTSSGIVAVESTQTGKLLWKTKATRDPVQEITFTLDGSLLIAASPSDSKAPAGWLRAHKMPAGVPDTSFDPVPGALCSHLALSPDGLFLAHSEMHSNSVLVWHLPSRQVAAFIRLNGADGPIVRLAFGLTVRHLFVAQQARVSGWNGESGQNFLAFHPSPVGNELPTIQSLAVIDHGSTLATTRLDPAAKLATLDLWNAETGRPRRFIPLPTSDLGPLAASPDGKLLALPTARDCWLWNAEKLVI